MLLKIERRVRSDNVNPIFLVNGRALRVANKEYGLRGTSASGVDAPKMLVFGWSVLPSVDRVLLGLKDPWEEYLNVFLAPIPPTVLPKLAGKLLPLECQL